MWVDGEMDLRRRPESTVRTQESLWAKLRRWINGHLVGEVPQADALCEFDCAREQCQMGEWATCKRRLSQAEGELWPGGEADSELGRIRRRDLRR